jgi:hypothetical protein
MVNRPLLQDGDASRGPLTIGTGGERAKNESPMRLQNRRRTVFGQGNPQAARDTDEAHLEAAIDGVWGIESHEQN